MLTSPLEFYGAEGCLSPRDEATYQHDHVGLMVECQTEAMFYKLLVQEMLEICHVQRPYSATLI